MTAGRAGPTPTDQKESPDVCGHERGKGVNQGNHSKQLGAYTATAPAGIGTDSLWGATPDEWPHWQTLSLTPDMLPCVSNPHAPISPGSSLQSLGKVPSLYNAARQVVGMREWTTKESTPGEVERWSREPDYGICLQTRRVRAIDVDVTDAEFAAGIAETARDFLGVLPRRERSNSPKFLLLLRLPGDYSKRIIRTAHGAVEFLATGQQCVISGTHPSGVRYEWTGGLPDAIREVTPEKFELFWQMLELMYGQGPSTTIKASAVMRMPRRAQDANDPAIAWLYANWEVRGEDARTGRVDIACPFKEQHSGDSGPSETSYLPAGVGGYAQGHISCLHATCSGRPQAEFWREMGYDPVLDSFDIIEGEAVRLPADESDIADLLGGAPAKRSDQRFRFKDIGEGTTGIDAARAPTMDLEAMLHSLVHVCGDKSLVAFRDVPGVVTSEDVMRRLLTHNRTPQPARTGGATVWVPTFDMWKKHPTRITVLTQTFDPRKGEICRSLDNKPTALNLWRPRPHTAPNDWESRVVPFLDHVAFLVPEVGERERFHDWLAHIEQRPGELPHNHYLLVATVQGVGRNWLAAVLACVWAGHVALDFDLKQTLERGFNGQLSRKLLAVVDEINEGGKGEMWEHSEKLKSMVTASERYINPKYGAQHVEVNCCRWLLFSNHESALPLGATDRRWNVIRNPSEPHPTEYYSRLYGLLEQPAFVASVREWMLRRDVSRFNPGARAAENEAKRAMVAASRSLEDENAEGVVRNHLQDVILSGDLFQRIWGVAPAVAGAGASRMWKLLAPIARRAGMEKHSTVWKVDGVERSAWVIRNPERWLPALSHDLERELHRIG